MVRVLANPHLFSTQDFKGLYSCFTFFLRVSYSDIYIIYNLLQIYQQSLFDIVRDFVLLNIYKRNNKHIGMNLELRIQVVDQLNQQYKTRQFTSGMTALQLIHCAEQAMKSNLDIINYELNSAIIERYGIKIQYCPISPFTQTQKENLQQFVDQINKLQKSFSQTSLYVSKELQGLKDLIVKHGIRIAINKQYHKYQLYFNRINIKQAMIFEALSKCQVFYTIWRERRKSGKEFYLDPLIQVYDNIKNKIGIVHSFHQKVLPKKQIRYFQKKSTDKKMKNVLFEAVNNRKYNQVKQLIAKGASLEQPGIIERLKRQMNCSHRACQLGDLELCKILHTFSVNWQAREKQGYTPLHFAVQAGNIRLVQFLIQEAKVDIQAKDIQERTSFYFACTQGDLDVIKYLHKKGADINNKSKLGRSALSKACYLGLVDVVRFLMECQEIILDSADGKGRTALHNSVFGPKGGRQGHKFGTNQKDSPECTQLLLQRGFQVDIKDIQQNTPMHVSMSSDGIDSIKILLAFGASLTALNVYEETPLMTGAKFGHLQAVKMLKEQYGDILTIKDVFSKNLMLLCAKFRQDDGKNVNRVFYYATDQLLIMAKNKQLLLIKDKNHITDWQEEIDYTFNELLKQIPRVQPEFRYFCSKCKELGLHIYNLGLQNLKILLDYIKNTDNQQNISLVRYLISERPFENNLMLKTDEFQSFLKWLITENSVRLFDFVASNEKELRKFIKVETENDLTFMEHLAQMTFVKISEMKEKALTYCLLKLNINWLDYIDSQHYYNILHLLIRHKKIGTLIQILKVLTGVKMDFITNENIISLLNDEQSFRKQNSQGQSPLEILLKNMLIHRDRQGFDPYNLALLMKDASAIKLLQDKINKHNGLKKSQFQVREYTMKLEQSKEELQKFNIGYQIEDQLSSFLEMISNSISKKQLVQYEPILADDPNTISKIVNIDNFSHIWKDLSNRKVYEIGQISQLQVLKQISDSQVLGIDIEYFYSQNSTLISIMQLSTLEHDYIVDFLSSATSHQSSQQFINEVKRILMPIAYDRRILKIMHGSDNDLCVIKSILKFSFLNFIDTARIDVEIRQKQNIRGLAILVKEYLGEHMSKDYQVSEWRIRPIPTSMLEYARRDSMVLPFLARKILSFVQNQKLKEVIFAGCRQAKKNKKSSQVLIKSIQAI